MIRLGDVDETEDNECNDDGFCLQEEDFEIEKIIVHPNYNNPRYANDIALIRLKESTATSSERSFHAFEPFLIRATFQTRLDRFACPSGSSRKRRTSWPPAAMQSLLDGAREVERATLRVRCCSGSDCRLLTLWSARLFTPITHRPSSRES